MESISSVGQFLFAARPCSYRNDAVAACPGCRFYTSLHSLHHRASPQTLTGVVVGVPAAIRRATTIRLRRPCPIEHRHLAVLPAPEPRHDRPPLPPTSATTIGCLPDGDLGDAGSSRNIGAYPSLPMALDRRFRIRDDRQAVGALSDAQRMGPHVAGARAVGGDAMTDIAATEAPAELEHLPGGRNTPSARSPMRSALEIFRISSRAFRRRYGETPSDARAGLRNSDGC